MNTTNFFAHCRMKQQACFVGFIVTVSSKEQPILLFSELSEEEVIALQNKLDSFYTIMSQEVEVLKEQSKKLQREKDIKTGKIITVVTIFNS